MNAKRLAQLGLLTTISLIIFIIELRIPNIAPIPGMKLGLANIVTVYAVYRCTAKETALILFTRIIFGSIFAGSMLTLFFSLGGGILCLLGMLLLKRAIDVKHIWVCSILGAVLHNIGQIAVAAVVMRTAAVISYLPFLLISGCAAGLFTGICAQILVARIDLKDL
ncbi:Gx transporter family protein [Ruminococcus sp. Marseille-P6503]|uniref:Gx transporter family protein n=1 Tax=Ruminococcus sp. Marseille-P6503 TaxID=2364796 RepID=UPI000F53F898|nr:Gx transporter family protein [Ruminococcus sp. Marseille-P6503]